MVRRFILSCESTVDMPYEYVNGRDIPLLFYSYMVDETEYEDDMGRNPGSLDKFYGFLRSGKIPKTSQINKQSYLMFLEEQLQKGDVLHIVFGSGMTKSIENANAAADELRGKYPDRKLVIIDSTCSSSGYGLLVDYAADMRDAGASLDETADWIIANRHNVHHQFFSTELDYYRKSGRMSGPTAMIATILNICPIMRLDDEGKIIAYSKVRGKRTAIKTTIDAMLNDAENGGDYDGKCFICHSDCIADAEYTRQKIYESFPKLRDKVRIFDIGTIIASHCGPGTVAVFFLGTPRVPGTK